MNQSPTDADLRHLVDTAVNPFCLMDHTGTAIWAGASIGELLGIPAEDIVGRSMLDFIAPASQGPAIEALAAAATDRRAVEGQPTVWEGVGPVFEILRADGTTVSCGVAVATPVRTGFPYFVLQFRRADAAHALEQTLIAMANGRPITEVLTHVAATLRGELPNAEIGILRRRRHEPDLEILVDGTGLAGWLSPAAVESLGPVTEVPGTVIERAVEDLPGPLPARAAAKGYRWLAALAARIDGDEDPPRAVVLVASRHPYAMHHLNHERVRRCGSLVTLVLQWERGRKAVEWAATHDVLTQLHNRAAFVDEVERIESEPPRANGTKPRCAVVLYLDLDDFKPVNDRHGHALGDRVLIEVAARLRRAIRPSDVVARLGGDEFAVLCPGLDDISIAEALAERLIAEVSQPVDVDGIRVKVGLSVGISPLLADDDADRVLGRADDALRAAKVGGKSRWQVA